MKRFRKLLAGLLVASMTFGMATNVYAVEDTENKPVTTALTMGNKPDNGTTNAEPFPEGTGESNSFRIPAMVTLDSGRIVAAADARWNTTYDGGGLDTIVSYSDDKGANWNYTFANYLGDNGNTYNGSGSTAFIDPCLTTDGKTVYMLVDLYPYGVALNGSGNTAPSTETGFNEAGKLLLKKSGESAYNYYLDGTVIKATDGTGVSGYTVDAKFNITGTDGTSTNLFFSDSPYTVARTSYLYLTKSTDGGETWSDPTLINLKSTSEKAYLVAPGSSLVLDDGKTVVFPCYSYNGEGTQQLSFIYSKDSGSTWKRSTSFSGASWSSESAVVELADGTLRFFYRNGTTNLCYVDYSWENGWDSAAVVETSVDTNSNCQISAISYSKTSDGKQVILVSCPTGPSEAGSDQSGASYRKNGRIFVGVVGEDNRMTWTSPIAVTENDNQFMYSCLTELSDGSIAILYEDKENAWGVGDSCYYTMSYNTYTANQLGLTFDTGSSEENSGSDTTTETYEETKDISLGIGESIKIQDATGNYEASYTGKGLNSGIATVVPKGTTTEASIMGQKVTSITDNKCYIYKEGQYAKLIGSSIEWVTNIEDATEWNVSSRNNGYYVYFGKYYIRYGNNSCSTVTQRKEGTSWTYSGGVFSSNRYTLESHEKIAIDGVNATDITLTGVAAGSTSVVVGTTLYNITVSKAKKDVTVMVGSTASFANTSGKVTVGNTSIATAKLLDGTLEIKGVVEGTTTVSTDTTDYNVTVIDAYEIEVVEGSIVTVSPADTNGDGTDDAEFELADGQYIEWTSDDSSLVGVAGVYDADNKVATDEAYITGNAVTDNAVLVTGTVYNQDKTVANTIKWLVTVKEEEVGTDARTVQLKIDITKIQNCTVYYSINGGALVEIKEENLKSATDSDGNTYYYIDALINQSYTEYGHGVQISFFADPDEGYALTYMASTNSAAEYYVLSDGNPDGTGSSAWPLVGNGSDSTNYTQYQGDNTNIFDTSSGFRWGLVQGNYNLAQLKAMFTQAIALGCDGTMCFTKNDKGTTYETDLTFVAQKLPSVEKVITSVNGEAYTDGMKIDLGDKIEYRITVTKYKTIANYGTITYSNDSLTDKLTNNEGYTYTSMGTTTTQDVKHEYDTYVILSLDNFEQLVENGKITNEAVLKYDYKSQYSNGTLQANAAAVAEIAVSTPDYVVDFGLPVEITVDEAVLGENNYITGGSAKYGTVTASGDDNTFTYTPTEVLDDVEHITLNLTKGSYGVSVYPATTVYYEENFAALSGFKVAGESKGGTQKTEVLGEAVNQFGFDEKYAGEYTVDNSSGASDGTEAVSDAFNEIATFEFTGTGVDIYANCTTKTGIATIQIKNSAGKIVKMLQVDTVTGTGGTASTEGQAIDSYALPIASVQELAHDTYTVKVLHSKRSSTELGGNLKLDGFRVYETLEDSSIFELDLEDNPTFVQLRDMVLYALKVNDSTSEDYGSLSKMATQVYDEVIADAVAKGDSDGVVAIVTSASELYGNKATLQDLLDNGPKNELFLYADQTLTFKVTTDRIMQIGLKAPAGNTSYTVTTKYTVDGTEKTIGGTAADITSSTDMFYKLGNEAGTQYSYTVTITNNGSNMLSITDLKICDDPNFVFENLTAEDIECTLKAMGYVDEPEYADATLNIALNDASGNVLATTALTANGVVGETNTFSATAIEEAVATLVAEGYELKDATYADQDVAYGEEATVTFSAEEIVEEEPEAETSVIGTIVSVIKNIFNKLFGWL